MLRKNLTEEGVAKLKTPATGQIDYFDALDARSDLTAGLWRVKNVAGAALPQARR